MTRRFRSRLFVQSLEDRAVPATFTVMNLNDSGPDSLRDCISKANAAGGADTVAFNAGLSGTITLTSGEISINGPVLVDGPGPATLTISGNNASRIFNTSAAAVGTAISISGLSLRAAKSPNHGAAIRGGDEQLTVTNCSFFANTTTTLGGAAVAMTAGGTFKATDCSFTGNAVPGAGGALNFYNPGTSVTLQRCTISGNKAGNAGGLYVSGDLLMDDCTVSGNTATSNGGGIVLSNYYDATAVFSIRNSTISGNSSQEGGGIFLYSFNTTLTVWNSTVTANTASVTGGGISRQSGTGTITIESSVVSGNSNAAAPDIFSSGKVNQKTSAVGSGTGFTKTDQGGNLPFQPHANLKLGALANNGGPTQTHLPASGSPLIDAGSNPGALTTDQRGAGFPRVIGNSADIGAVEIVSLLVTNTSDSGAGSLRQAILHANSVAGPDTLTFDATVFATSQIIKLTSGEIAISDALTILGPSGKVTIDGNASSRIFNCTSAPAASAINLQNLFLTNAKSTVQGGAVLVTDEALTLKSCAITNSRAPSGGAISMGTGSLLIEDSTLSGNSSTNGDGGAITTLGAPLTIRRCTLSSNSAAQGISSKGFGGAISFDVNGSLTIEDSTLSGNSTDATNGIGGGGAIYFSGNGANFLISNSTLSGNSAAHVGGGAICWQSSTGIATIQNSTITNNSANGGGGMISLGYGTYTLNSTIISGNSGSTSPDVFLTLSDKIAGNNNLIGVVDATDFTLTGTGNLTGTMAAPLNAKLGPLVNNGGPTLTHALLAGSPAFSRGSNIAGLINDQRGVPFARLVGAAVDIGAIESPSTAPAVVAFDGGPGVTTTGMTTYNFTLTYADGAAIDVATLDDNDITVTGPAFPSGVAAHFLSVNVNGSGTPRTATYQVTAPAGGFTGQDSGSYSVNVNANQVNATSGQSVAPIVAGTFVVAVPRLITVNATNDESTDSDGKTSLREAIAAANNISNTNDTITFDASVFATPQTILLTLGQLALTDSISITGPAAKLTIDAGGLSRHFFIDCPGSPAISLSALTLINGNNVSLSGGSIRTSDEVVTLSQITFANNTANGNFGGAVSVVGAGTVVIQDCVFTGNQALSAGSKGGAINIFAGSVSIIRSSVSGNSADSDGAGIFCSSGNLTMTESTVSGNTSNKTTAANGGGGICLYGGSALTMTNCTISGNTIIQAGSGGGIALVNFAGTALIQNSTIAGNNALTAGGGIARVSGGGALTLQSTLLAGNLVAGTNNSKSDLSFDSPSIVAANNNLIGIQAASNNAILSGAGNLTGSLSTPLNAKLGPLIINGGPTETRALLSGSPAINNGSNLSSLLTDQRGTGFARSVNQTDIGAFEVQLTAAKITSVQINDGTAQRSRVTSLLITFDQPPLLPNNPADGFQLKRQSDNAIVTLAGTSVGNTVTLTFAGGPVDSQSLADGRYTLTAIASKIANLDGDGNGTVGDDFVLIGNPGSAPKLFRLFGDADGNGVVDGVDFGAFRTAFNTNSNIFDFDGSSIVDGVDFGQFRQRFGVVI